MDSNDLKFMKEAYSLAQEAATMGEIPVGAVVVREGEIIGRGFNRRLIDNSPFAHAEMLAMSEAAKSIDSWRFDDCTLYVTLEPCVMCAGAAVQCRMKRIVYASRDPKAGAAGTLYDIPRDKRLAYNCLVEEGILKEECSKMLQDFFHKKRKKRL